MKNKRHNFTLNGKEISGIALAKALNCTLCILYDRSNRHNTDNGEELEILVNTPVADTRTIFLLWNEKVVPSCVVAKEMGIHPATFLKRLRDHRKDCDLAYFPGRIPSHLWKSPPQVNGRIRKETGKWGALGKYARPENLKKMPSPSEFEKTLPEKRVNPVPIKRILESMDRPGSSGPALYTLNIPR